MSAQMILLLVALCASPVMSDMVQCKDGTCASMPEDEINLLQKSIDLHRNDATSELMDQLFAQIEAAVAMMGDCEDGQPLVIDQGGGGTKALYFGGKNKDTPEIIWDSEELSPTTHAKVPLTVALLKSCIEKFLKEQQDKAGKSCTPTLAFSFAARTMMPGKSGCATDPKTHAKKMTGAYSSPPANLAKFKATVDAGQAAGDISWGCEFADISGNIFAANDIQVALLGGHKAVVDVTAAKDVSVMTFVFGTSPNGGYVLPHGDSAVDMNVRMGFMYSRVIPSDVSSSETKATVLPANAYKQYMSYNPPTEEEKTKKLVLSMKDGSFVDAATFVKEANELAYITSKDKDLADSLIEHKMNWPDSMSDAEKTTLALPFTALMRDLCLKKLISEVDEGGGYLDADNNGGQIWRQRMTQLAYGLADSFKAENGASACRKANKRWILLLGGNSIPLSGKLHQCVYTDEGTWYDVLSNAACDTGEVSDGVKNDMSTDAKIYKFLKSSVAAKDDMVAFGSTSAVVIPGFGPSDCKFNVVLGSGGPLDIKAWQSLTHITGGSALTHVDLDEEVLQGRLVPWRKSGPLAEGYLSEDAKFKFSSD